VRYRIDGVLTEVFSPKRMLAPLLVSRLKVMAKLDIAEKAGSAGRPYFGANCRSRYRHSHVYHSLRITVSG
jgi:type II secretory ATPase GspE/PulE/Tfp pilus assembly ATPase PilB-like protein